MILPSVAEHVHNAPLYDPANFPGLDAGLVVQVPLPMPHPNGAGQDTIFAQFIVEHPSKTTMMYSPSEAILAQKLKRPHGSAAPDRPALTRSTSLTSMQDLPRETDCIAQNADSPRAFVVVPVSVRVRAEPEPALRSILDRTPSHQRTNALGLRPCNCLPVCRPCGRLVSREHTGTAMSSSVLLCPLSSTIPSQTLVRLCLLSSFPPLSSRLSQLPGLPLWHLVCPTKRW